MARPLTFWFDLASTYSYLSAMRIADMAEAVEVDLRWQPFLLGPVFAAQGWDNSPFNIYPAKGRYMWRDMERIAAARGLGFRRPEAPGAFPRNSVKAARVALRALTRPEGPEFCRAVYRTEFEEGADIAEDDVLALCLARAGLPVDLLAEAQDPAHRPALRDATARAQALGLFGAPSFTVDAEVFWGDDRLEAALDWARYAAVPK